MRSLRTIMAKSLDEVDVLVRTAIAALAPARLRTEVQKVLIVPIQQRRTCLTKAGVEAQGDLWVFARLPERDVGLAYAEEGYGAMGWPWGLVFVASTDFGDTGGWYSTLLELVEDSGWF
jgi:hypothetical protein